MKRFIIFFTFFFSLAVISRYLGGVPEYELDLDAAVDKIPSPTTLALLCLLYFLLSSRAAALALTGNIRPNEYKNSDHMKCVLGVCFSSVMFAAWYPLLYKIGDPALAMLCLCSSLILSVFAVRFSDVKKKKLNIILILQCIIEVYLIYVTQIYKILS